ncbi:uncharacterized protein E0L32_009095 [Thyridium curvatum]|uniref:Beta-lactamase-related domain-containing protein n=1 Tax=Thyridium curvatum TaxID=1093900 RepID=A0A507AST8_9PEZI|nr:uncharacterized protein E0L32_009095 [Thyridium curvatum]TPX09756.1 hypothetical protein E0L32_009095 [Thyridium curvatum]
MAELDAILEACTSPDTGFLHGATFVAVGRQGNDIYRKSFGRRKVDAKALSPLTSDTVTWIASQTKLVTSVAAMQIVERGLIGLDDDVRETLPQLKELKVITGFEDPSTENFSGRPILEDVKGPLTLRHLLTHTSGFAYDQRHPLLVKYSTWANRRDHMFSGTIEGSFHPLIFQPGASWRYGPGLDWAGHVIAKLTGMNFDQYEQQNIWEPLGAKNTTFFPAKRGLTPDDIHESAHRDPNKGDNPQNLEPGQSPWKFDPRDALGGAGLFSTANDYSKLLAALLSGGGPLLSTKSVDELFRPQIGAESMAALREILVVGTGPDESQSFLWRQSPQQWKDVMEVGHCLCGVVNSEDVEGRRRQNTVSWDGLPNLFWFIDCESGVAATFFTQVLPSDDLSIRRLLVDLEKALYKVVNDK